MPCKPSLRAPCYLSRPPLALPLFDWGLTRQVILPTQNPASESARRDAHLRLRSCSGRCSLAPPSPPAPRHPSSASKMPLPATATRPPDKTRSAPVVPIQPLPGGSGGGGGGGSLGYLWRSCLFTSTNTQRLQQSAHVIQSHAINPILTCMTI